jgi:hypothetical protein
VFQDPIPDGQVLTSDVLYGAQPITVESKPLRNKVTHGSRKMAFIYRHKNNSNYIRLGVSFSTLSTLQNKYGSLSKGN